MGKRYVMFVDERGFLSSNSDENITMVGVVFEYDYCIGSKSKECELRTKLNGYKEKIFSHNNFDMPFDDILLDENVYKNINMIERKKFVGELPSLFNSLKFTVITSSIKQDTNKSNDLYSLAVNKLLKKFYSFIVNKNGEACGIIMEAKKKRESYEMQQNFFNIYNERNMNLSILGNIQDKISAFIVCEKSSKIYGACIELSNILNNIIYRVLNGYNEIDGNLISFIEYGSKNKIFNSIKHKIYKDVEIGIPSDQLQIIHYNNIEAFGKELKNLKEQLMLKDIRINEKEKEINNLNNEIQLLSQQLEEVLIHRKDNNIISRIFSDIDFSIKDAKEIATVGKN